MPTPAGPNTNQFRCEACGRHFNSEGELKDHQVGCLEAKQSGKIHGDKISDRPAEEGEDREWVSTP
jgi:hypothetical protein